VCVHKIGLRPQCRFKLGNRVRQASGHLRQRVSQVVMCGRAIGLDPQRRFKFGDGVR
jgi:hypothetical protein